MIIKYYRIVRHQDICKNIIKYNETVVILYVKLTNPLSFQIRFPKILQIYRGQVANPWHQIPHGHSIAKPRTPLQNIIVGNLNMT